MPSTGPREYDFFTGGAKRIERERLMAARFSLAARWRWLLAALADPQLPGTAMGVAARLVDYADGDRRASPGHEQIATDLGVTVRGVRKGIAYLVAAGYIQPTERSARDRHASYVLLTPPDAQ